MKAINYGDKFYRVNRNDRDNLEDHNFLIYEVISKWKEGAKEFVYLCNERAPKFSSISTMSRSTHQMLGSSNVYVLGEGFICRAENIDAVIKEIRTNTFGFYIKKEDASDEIKNLMKNEIVALNEKVESLKNKIKRIRKELGNG